MAIVTITVEYKITTAEDTVAHLMADLVQNNGVSFGSTDFSIFDFKPEEKVLSAVVDKK